MELHLDASIDKLDNLAINVQLDKEKYMEKEQRFAYSFLQIPPNNGHPCCSAMHFPLIKYMEKEQRQTEPERAEAERVEAGSGT